jgi:hypothetical protein
LLLIIKDLEEEAFDVGVLLLRDRGHEFVWVHRLDHDFL